MNNDELDASIPVLTEIITLEQDFAKTASALLPLLPLPLLPLPLTARSLAAVDAPEFAAVADVPEVYEVPELTEVIIPAEVPSPPAISDGQWDALEHQISQRVLSQLQTRIDFVLEQQVKECLSNVLQLAADGVLAELRRSLNSTLEEMISSAVGQEIAPLKTDQKSTNNLTEK